MANILILHGETFRTHLTAGDDMFEDGNKYRDHPKVYINKYHHAIYPNMSGKTKGNCAVISKYEFRMNDYYYSSADWLVDGTTIGKDVSWKGPNFAGEEKVWASSFLASFFWSEYGCKL